MQWLIQAGMADTSTMANTDRYGGYYYSGFYRQVWQKLAQWLIQAGIWLILTQWLIQAGMADTSTVAHTGSGRYG